MPARWESSSFVTNLRRKVLSALLCWTEKSPQIQATLGGEGMAQGASHGEPCQRRSVCPPAVYPHQSDRSGLKGGSRLPSLGCSKRST